MDQNFILTTDKETADKLKSMGFTCLGKEDSEWRFLNDSSIKLVENEVKNVTYTNIINV